jgi:hypothetical protein
MIAPVASDLRADTQRDTLHRFDSPCKAVDVRGAANRPEVRARRWVCCATSSGADS